MSLSVGVMSNSRGSKLAKMVLPHAGQSGPFSPATPSNPGWRKWFGSLQAKQNHFRHCLFLDANGPLQGVSAAALWASSRGLCSGPLKVTLLTWIVTLLRGCIFQPPDPTGCRKWVWPSGGHFLHLVLLGGSGGAWGGFQPPDPKTAIGVAFSSPRTPKQQ